MTKTPRVLLVEDTRSLSTMYMEYLREEPYEVLHAADGANAIKLIEEQAPEVVLLDLNLPDMDGKDILAWAKDNQIPCTIIVITAYGSLDLAVDVIRLGARDYIEKPFTAGRFKTTINNALEFNKLQYIVEDIQTTFEREKYHDFDGSSLPMQAVYRIIDAAATSKASIFITGESGTGKEVCARAIHQQSGRKKQPFVAINCAAIPKNLMESEIFGHIKGSFTGATADRQGAASMANGGTLFLDEIGEMDIDLQTKLLRFVQTGSFHRVGSSKLEQVDVRFVCATNRNPLEEVEAGRFREDLYYRLHVVPLHLPPLRDRGDDIMVIARKFLNDFAIEEKKIFRDFTVATQTIIQQYEWPGNIRQLQNVIRNIIVLHNDELVQIEHLPPPLDQQHNRGPEASTIVADKPSVNDEIRPLSIIEREAIELAIAHCNGNIPRAAALLEVSPSTIYRKRQSWNTSSKFEDPNAA